MRRIRVEKSKNFTTINNEFIFNKDLSLKAKGDAMSSPGFT